MASKCKCTLTARKIGPKPIKPDSPGNPAFIKEKLSHVNISREAAAALTNENPIQTELGQITQTQIEGGSEAKPMLNCTPQATADLIGNDVENAGTPAEKAETRQRIIDSILENAPNLGTEDEPKRPIVKFTAPVKGAIIASASPLRTDLLRPLIPFGKCISLLTLNHLLNSSCRSSEDTKVQPKEEQPKEEEEEEEAFNPQISKTLIFSGSLKNLIADACSVECNKK